MTENIFSIRFNGKLHAIPVDFGLVQEIERELGGLVSVCVRFSGENWSVTELVTLMQMLLQAAGETVDYFYLGETIMKEGIARYLSSARAFLKLILDSE